VHAASGGHTRVQKLKKSKLGNLNDAYIISMPMFATWKLARIVVFTRNRESHFERKECFSAASCKVLCEFLTEAKISVLGVERRLYNYNIDVYVCNV